MYFYPDRDSLKLAGSTNNLLNVISLKFSSTKTALRPREYSRIDLVSIRKGGGDGRKPLPILCVNDRYASWAFWSHTGGNAFYNRLRGPFPYRAVTRGNR